MPERMVERLEARTLRAVDPVSPVAWFRADAITAADGATVATWFDASGNGFNATQADPTRRPRLDSDALNGRPALQFSAGSSTQLSFARPVSGDFTLMVVFGSPQGVGDGTAWYEAAGIVDGEVAGVRSDFGLSLNQGGRVLAGTGGPDTLVGSGLGFDDGRAHVATFTRTASTGATSLHVDGRLFGRATGGTQPLTAPPRLTIGSLQTNINYFTGDIGEVRVFATALSDDTRVAVEAELATAFNVAPSPSAWFANPVINRNFPDPGVVFASGTYYAYATNGAGQNVQTARSSDLVTWTTMPDALPTLPAWAQAGRTWAPDVAVTATGRYNLYYTAWSRATGRQVIGVATATSPSGPFVPSGSAPLVTQFDQGGAIDPSVYTDRTGTQYLLWKNDGNAVGRDTFIYIQRLSPDGLSLFGAPAPLIRQDQPWEGSLVEGPVLWERNGKYYLFYCANNFAGASYATGYAVSNSLLGGYEKAPAPLVMTTGAVVGPGGPELVAGPDGNVWMLYHSWEGNLAYRSTSADMLEWFGDVPALRGPSRATQPVPVRPRVVGRHVFYNNSAFDGRDPSVNGRDDAAVATDKQALLPGQTGTFANVTSYTRGINGIMIDVTELPQSPVGLVASNFGVQVGSGAAWVAGPEPSSVTVRRGAGALGSDRITLTWPERSIRNKWVHITVPTGLATGLAAPDVFAFGNLVGDTGGAAPGAPARVTAADILAVRRSARSSLASITNAFDLNRDGRVNVLDLAAVHASLLKTLPILVL